MSTKKKNTDNDPKIDWDSTWQKTKSLAHQTKITSGSILNGVVGDHLEKWNTPFSRELNFYRNGNPIRFDTDDGAEDFPKMGSRVCILVHGLVSDETMWKFTSSEDDYGSLLETELAYTPLYLRYNSGRHISDNGQDLDFIISSLYRRYYKTLKEIVFISHSMGGLVTRSACYYGKKNKSKWVSLVSKVFFIGSPHHGAPLEKFGNLATTILEKIPNPFTHLTKATINLRSAGIKDLRYGFLVEEDWKGKDPDSFVNSEKTIVPLLPKVKYYVITGTLMKDPDHFLSRFFGDAIVGKESSHGKSGNKKYDLPIPGNHICEIPGITHIQLMKEPLVYKQIKQWMKLK